MMSSYVMVPVPEEHVQEIMAHVVRLLQRASIEEWDEASVSEFFGKADEASRSLLSVVARAVLSAKELTDVQASDFVQLSQRETLGIMRELNDAARELNRPNLMFVVPVVEELPNGRTREKRCLTMGAPVAQMFRDAERELHLSEPSPLETGAG
jgi:hypothetical protein